MYTVLIQQLLGCIVNDSWNKRRADWLLVLGDAEPRSLHIQRASLCPAAIKADSGPWGAGENFLY